MLTTQTNTMSKDKLKRLDALRRQLERLKKNFAVMVENEEEADMMLDWMNKIRKQIKRLETELGHQN
jgi:ATP-dependent RNA circularization protein (DNA/RNA ligase family)